jgi:hypothetical protein
VTRQGSRVTPEGIVMELRKFAGHSSLKQFAQVLQQCAGLPYLEIASDHRADEKLLLCKEVEGGNSVRVILLFAFVG